MRIYDILVLRRVTLTLTTLIIIIVSNNLCSNHDRNDKIIKSDVIVASVNGYYSRTINIVDNCDYELPTLDSIIWGVSKKGGTSIKQVDFSICKSNLNPREIGKDLPFYFFKMKGVFLNLTYIDECWTGIDNQRQAKMIDGRIFPIPNNRGNEFESDLQRVKDEMCEPRCCPKK